ncbi:exopolyphosphatase / guanosine-5'-triphosphate,3'-diphosphate pyrophosphatase [Kocuria rhizophila]|uniref:Ppx/GppA phosphatase family protein n=1 Tax=Kocuria rhizophila (strain ATCC 9341 / DSM 348 / NBRC 103217 / DC2201) TaxID=378753 RepID=B2GLQ2_KOCRD|nr:Ppx/GppA phosphatase family protein [Kocuria rhizophila]ASE12096.1 Ppx/GppA family phosphatase [Kocuria rhizophila]MCC5673021.1 Ppx/GppA family phosphatase [Kocuria rhizophila]MDV5999680.1 Ppx/GppA family phosphatase [Kocuria rhizophila]WTI32397.1 Ppx/GppA family phosphatase [Kocuria rhizophila]VEH74605.1 Guanosine-5'-triphosphate,3'-diphosphate pyrophosphatase [Kocuria rhizophila]
MRVAAIDCGTNSIRLLIADARTDESGRTVLRDVVREMRIVRLGQGVDATGWLAEAALKRTFAAADEYAALIEHHGADRVRFVATSATRDAGNRDVFVAGIRSRLGVEPEVVSGDEEAALSFRGALNAAAELDPADRVLVVDLGGGSTECVLGTPREVIAARSVDVGCVRMTERHLGSNPPTEEQQARVLRDVDEAMDVVARTVPLERTTRLVGVAGTVTTVTAMALGLEHYDPERINGTVLEIPDVTRACRELTAMTREQRAALGFMHEGRVDVIGAGALVWRRVVERVARATDGRVRTVTASEHDILDGIGLSLVP